MPSAYRALLIEDVEEMREMMLHLFEGVSEIKVTATASNTVEARLEIERRRPDLVLLDEILPGESSVDLLEELVKEGIPVILMTSVENPTHEVPAGALARIQKPDWDQVESAREPIRRQILSALGRK